MADSSFYTSQKSRKSREIDKKKLKESKSNSPNKRNDKDDDRRHGTSGYSQNRASYRDVKNETSNRNDRRLENRQTNFPNSDERRVSYRSEESYRQTSPDSHRYNNHDKKRDTYRSSSQHDDWHRNSRFVDSEDQRSVYNNERHDNLQMYSERSVSFTDRSFEAESHSKRDELFESLYEKIDYLNNQIDRFAQENEMLRCQLREVQNTSGVISNGEVNITFENKHLEIQFLPVLEELISCLLNGQLSIEDVHQLCISRQNSGQQHESFNELPEGELFSLDNSTTEPSENTYIPWYETSFGEILQSEGSPPQEESDGKKGKNAKFGKFCFNCDGSDHVIGMCPFTINYRKVANAKKKRAKAFVPSVRYHVHGVKETDFKPGIISDELRKAMDLGPDQIPEYIYRMRILNYPPGWLEEATVESSGITLYGLDKSEEDEKNSMEGAQDYGNSERQYNQEKFIDFPGFNVPLPPNIIDEAFKFGYPPLQRHQLRCVVEQNMPKPNVCPKRKRRLSPLNSKPAKIQRLEEDMEIEETADVGSLEFIPPLPEEALPPPPPEETLPPPPPGESSPPSSPPEIIVIEEDDDGTDDNILAKDGSDSHSGTHTPRSDAAVTEKLVPVTERFKLQNKELEELEELKKRIVMELDLASASSSPAVFDSNPSEADEEDTSNTSFRNLNEVLLNREISNDMSSLSECSVASSSMEMSTASNRLQRSDSQRSGSKLVSLGTPSLSRHSSFKKLPEYDKFSKDVTSHINFENLPNSTGTYQKMKKVIKKVKEKINSLMQ